MAKLLWLGEISGSKEFYSFEALAAGLRLYNQATLEVCRSRQVECIDLEKMLPKDTSVFYDDIRWNEAGAEKISEILTQYFLQHSPAGISGTKK